MTEEKRMTEGIALELERFFAEPIGGDRDLPHANIIRRCLAEIRACWTERGDWALTVQQGVNERDALQAANERSKVEALEYFDDYNNQLSINVQLKAANDRLKEREQYLATFLEEAAHAAATGHNPAEYLATKAPTTLRDEINRLKQERDALQRLLDGDYQPFKPEEVTE